MKQELIDRFELEHPNEPAYLPIVGGKEHLGIETSRIYSDAFQNWLMDTVIADLQKENEHLEYERGVAQGNVTLQMDLRAIAERGLFTLKEECDKLTAKIERLKLQKKDLEEQNYNLTEACCEEREKYDKLKERVEGECIWADQSDIEMDGTYETSCDNMWAFTEDGIKENGITYCPFCGKRIVELTPEEMEMNDD